MVPPADDGLVDAERTGIVVAAADSRVGAGRFSSAPDRQHRRGDDNHKQTLCQLVRKRPNALRAGFVPRARLAPTPERAVASSLVFRFVTLPGFGNILV